MNTKFAELLYSMSSENMKQKAYWGEGGKLTNDNSLAANVFREMKAESGKGKENCWYYLGIEGRARNIAGLLKGYFEKLRIIFLNQIATHLNSSTDAGKDVFIDKGFCYFAYYWIIKENGDKIADKLTFWERLLFDAGIPYASAAFSSMEDVIQYYSCRKSLDCSEWHHLVSDWAAVKENYSPNLSIPYPERKPNEPTYFTVAQIKEIANIGTEETTKETRKSISEIENYLTRILSIDETIGNTINDIFGVQAEIDPIPLILDTQIRRNWYFLKMLNTILSKQREMILNFYKGEGNIELQYAYEEIKEAIWFDMPRGSFQNDDELEEAIDNARVIIRKIALGFGRCLDKSAYLSQLQKLEHSDSTEYEWVDHEWIDPECFEKPELIFEDNMKGYVDYRDGETFFNAMVLGKQTLEGKIGNITREMLLVSALIAKVYGANISMDYICNNMLFNSRYSAKLSLGSDETEVCMFDQYVAEAFKELDCDGKWPEYETHLDNQDVFYEELGGYIDYLCRMQCLAEASTEIMYYYKDKMIKDETVNIFRLMVEGKELFV